jgi:hypothetical protein
VIAQPLILRRPINASEGSAESAADVQRPPGKTILRVTPVCKGLSGDPFEPVEIVGEVRKKQAAFLESE